PYKRVSPRRRPGPNFVPRSPLRPNLDPDRSLPRRRPGPKFVEVARPSRKLDPGLRRDDAAVSRSPRGFASCSRTAASLHSEVGSAARDLRLVEIVVRRRVHLVTLDLLADRVEADRMRDRDPRCLFLEDHLRLLVELGAIGLLRGLRRLDDQVLERLVAPARVVAAAFHRLAAEQGPEEIVRLAVVA